MKKHQIKLSLTSLASLMLILGFCIYLNAQDNGNSTFGTDEKDDIQALDEKGLEQQGISLEEEAEDVIEQKYGLAKESIHEDNEEIEVGENVNGTQHDTKMVMNEVPTQPAKNLTQDEQAEKVRREAHFANAVAEMLEAQSEWVDKNYEVALKKFDAAYSEFDQASKMSPRVKAKQKQIRKVQAKINEEWAESLIVEATNNYDAKLFDLAVKKLEVAIAHNPALKDSLLAKIDKYKKDKSDRFYSNSIVASKVDGGKAKRDADIKILFEQGKLLAQNDRLDEAKDKFKQILRINPFNAKARSEIRKITRREAMVGKESRINTVAERISEVGWTWTDPLPKLRAKKDVQKKGPVAEKQEDVAMKKMDRKLNQIIIPKLKFTKESIENVLGWLREESKRRDGIYNEGVNFLLVGSSGGSISAKGETVESEEDEDADWPDEDDSDTGEKSVPQGGTKVTIALEKVTLGDAIRFICSNSGLKFSAESNGVLITSAPGVSLPVKEQFVTQYFSVKPSFFRGVIGLGRASTKKSAFDGESDEDDGDDGDDDQEPSPEDAVNRLRAALSQLGIDFTLKDREGNSASVSYQSTISRLIVTHSPENLSKIQEFVDLYNRGQRQISIQAKFVEITQTDIDELGFQWLLTQGSHNGTTPFGQDFVLDASSGSGQKITSAVRFMNSISSTGLAAGAGEVLKATTVLGNLEFQNVINAISQKGNTDVLSAPKVTTISGEEATIKRVQQRYFPTNWTEPEGASSGSSSQSSNGYKPSIPEYEDVTEIGVILTVVPTVMPGSTEIELVLQPKVRDFVGYDDEIKIRLGVDDDGEPIYHIPKMPIIDLRSVETKVFCDDGETVVLGGLITERVRSIDDKVPLLGDIPLFGRLFQNKAEFSEKFNLLIFVTARMVDSSGRTIINHRVDGLTNGKPETQRY